METEEQMIEVTDSFLHVAEEMLTEEGGARVLAAWDASRNPEEFKAVDDETAVRLRDAVAGEIGDYAARDGIGDDLERYRDYLDMRRTYGSDDWPFQVVYDYLREVKEMDDEGVLQHGSFVLGEITERFVVQYQRQRLRLEMRRVLRAESGQEVCL